MLDESNHYFNAYRELVEVLAENGKSITEIEWVSTKAGAIDIDFFLLVCEGTFYTNPSPCGSLDPYLIVAGRDFWLSRLPAGRIKDTDHWCFHAMPQEPQKRVNSFTLFKLYPGQGKNIGKLREQE